MIRRLSTLLAGCAGSTRFIFSLMRSEDRSLIQRLRSRKLTYLSRQRLHSLADTCRAIEKSGLEGIIVEAGCALGGSTILIASVKGRDRPMRVYDVFGVIPPPTAADPAEVHERYRTIIAGLSKGIGGNRYYGYEPNLYQIVQDNLMGFGIMCDLHNVSLIPGLLQESMVVNQPIAFAHIDVDWYEPVKTCLERIVPHLVTGGSVILDDYHDWGGCRKAVDEYFHSARGRFDWNDRFGSLQITRVANG
jgi:hypothetical protein